MKVSKAQQNELKVWEFFIPPNCQWRDKTDRDVEMFFEWSQQGKHKDILLNKTYTEQGRSYFHALCWGKKHAMINVHEIWEPSFVAGDWMGYKELLKGVPREVVDWIKGEIFKGADREVIEECYEENFS